MISLRTDLLLAIVLGLSHAATAWANEGDARRARVWLNAKAPEMGAHCIDQATDAFLEPLNGRMRLLACQYHGASMQSLTAFANGSDKAESMQWVSAVIASAVKGQPDALNLAIRFKLERGTAQSAGVAIAFVFFDWSTKNYVLLPAAVYNGNRCKIVNRGYAKGLDRKYLYKKDIPLMSNPIPHLAVTDGDVSRLNVNVCNLSTPAICFFSKKKQLAFILLAEQKTQLASNGFIVEESADRTRVSLVVSAPGVRERKALFVGFTDSPDRGATIKVGEEINLRLRLYSLKVDGIPGLLEKFMTVRKQITGANQPRDLVPLSQVRYWMTQRIDSRFHDGAVHKFYCPENAKWISFGWVGGLMNTFPMLALGDAMHLDRVTRTFDFAIPRAQGEAGYFYGALDQNGKCFSRDSYPELPEIALTRKNADVLFWMVKQFMLLRAQGRGEAVKPAWEQNIKRLADAFVTTWKRCGQWGSHVNNQTGQVAVYNTSGGVMAVGGLALAADYYGEPTYLTTAKEAAEFYYRRDFVAQGQTTGGCADILQNADSETAAGFMAALMALYETTGDATWLEKSRNLANLVATWTCSYDYQLPAKTELARRGARLAGVYWASTQNKHAAPGICTSSGDALFKIYRATGDRRYAELLRDIVHAHGESIRPGGLTNERLTYCDADAHSVGNRGNHVTGWNELNGILMAMEIPGIYLRTDRSEMYVFDHVAVQVAARDENGVTLRISNKTEHDATVSVLAESAAQAKSPLGYTAFLNWPKVNVKTGQTVEHVVPLPLNDRFGLRDGQRRSLVQPAAERHTKKARSREVSD